MDLENRIDTSDTKEPVPVILAVEDDEDNQLLLRHTVTMFGWKYVSAVDAIAAISLAKKQPPSLILLDIILPEISGLQIAMMLKSQPQTRNIPLIAVTGLATEAQKNLIFAVGFDDYICKPFYLEDFA